MILSIQNLLPGQTLLAAVRDAKGQVLLPQGAVLTDSIISAFKSRGIASADIDVIESDEEKGSRRDAEKSRIETLFAAVPSTSELWQLRRILLEMADAS